MEQLEDLIHSQPHSVIEGLRAYISEQRMTRLESVVSERTDNVVTVVEGLINFGNVSAVMRSAEALGFHRFHIIEGGERFKNSSRTSQGADKWLDTTTWPEAKPCVAHLKSAGYTVVVTHLDETSVPIDTLDFTKPTALVFGNEQGGVSPEMIELADKRCIIPMTGFVQSFNISVAAALSLYHAFQDRVRRQGNNGDLPPDERKRLLASYCVKSVKHAEEILQEAGIWKPVQ